MRVPQTPPANTPNTISNAEKVITVHGFMMNHWAMAGLAWHLRRGGFHVSSFHYRSMTGTIETHVDALVEAVSRWASPVNFVAHSMGCVIVRAAIDQLPAPIVGRTVLIAPPNHGTPWARLSGPIRRYMFRCLEGISDASDSFVNQLDQSTRTDIGTIAGRFDSTIPLRCTRLADSPHRTIAATHNSVLIDPRVGRLTTRFLRDGKFSSPGESLVA